MNKVEINVGFYLIIKKALVALLDIKCIKLTLLEN